MFLMDFETLKSSIVLLKQCIFLTLEENILPQEINSNRFDELPYHNG